MIPQRVDRLGPIKPLELFPQGESAGQVEALQRRRHAAEVGGIHFLSDTQTLAGQKSHHNPVRQHDGSHLVSDAAGDIQRLHVGIANRGHDPRAGEAHVVKRGLT